MDPINARLHEMDMEMIDFIRRQLDMPVTPAAPRIHRPRGYYVDLIWVLNFLPVPIIKYRNIWSDYDLSTYFFRLISMITITIQRVFRVLVFFIGASFYLHRVLERFFLFGNELTFSNNFFKDIITFIVRNNNEIFQRISKIEQLDLLTNFESTSTFKNFMNILANFVVITLDYKCNKIDGEMVCSAKDTSLIYKFNNVLGKGDLITVTVYLLYALIGNLICLNILYLYAVNLLKITRKPSQFLSNLTGLIWNSLKNLA